MTNVSKITKKKPFSLIQSDVSATLITKKFDSNKVKLRERGKKGTT